jgi:3D (Asp-Asp-Asp) domain-containing protein
VLLRVTPACYFVRMKGAIQCALLAAVVVTAGGCRRIRPPGREKPALRRVVVATGYCPCGKCCSWHRNWLGVPVYSTGSSRGKRKHVGITASGARARTGTIAADTRVYPFGTVMYVEGYGYGRVEDRGGGIKGQHIDLYFPSHRQALEWGRKNARIAVWYPPGHAPRETPP